MFHKRHPTLSYEYRILLHSILVKQYALLNSIPVTRYNCYTLYLLHSILVTTWRPFCDQFLFYVTSIQLEWTLHHTLRLSKIFLRKRSSCEYQVCLRQVSPKKLCLRFFQDTTVPASMLEWLRIKNDYVVAGVSW